MFIAPRFIVVDDDPIHAKAIAACVQELGSVCATVVYSVETDVPPHVFSGARVIFMDLQLQDRTYGDFARHYSEIQRILSNVINPDGGPYMLVLWTDAPERAGELEAYLEQNLFVRSPHTRPLTLLPLSKTDYIDFSTGEPSDSIALGKKIRADISSVPSMAALLQWEADVLTATNGVLQNVMSAAVDTGGRRLDALPSVLHRIATDVAGVVQAEADPEAAVHMALLPLLQDQLQYAASKNVPNEVWMRAFEGAAGPLSILSRASAAKLNSSLHLKLAERGEIKPVSWGALSGLEDNFPWRDFGLSDAQSYVDDVVIPGVQTKWQFVETDLQTGKLQPGNLRRIRLGQIRIGAACDFAQKSDGPVPFVLTAFIPVREDHPTKRVELMQRSTAWLSPLLDVGSWGRGHLFVEPRFLRIRGASQMADLRAFGRLREQLLIELISGISHHSSRPGITQFVGEDVL